VESTDKETSFIMLAMSSILKFRAMVPVQLVLTSQQTKVGAAVVFYNGER
jgi:hypothetical protein